MLSSHFSVWAVAALWLVSAIPSSAQKPMKRAEFRTLSMQDESGTVKPNGLLLGKNQADLIRWTPGKIINGAATYVEPSGAGITTASWQELGPSHVAGRIRAVAIHPTNPNRIVVGAAGGGIWISSDAGNSWAKASDTLPSLTISSIVYDPVNPNHLYAGTGEIFVGGEYTRTGAGGGASGAGILKSTDGGQTWTQLAQTNPQSNPAWQFTNRIAIHPTNPQTLFAAVANFVLDPQAYPQFFGGVYRSTDAGSTWSEMLNGLGPVLDLKINPSNAQHLVATVHGGVQYSFDGGASWQAGAFPVSQLPAGRRIEIAFSGNGLVFAADGFGTLFRSTNGGVDWTYWASTPGAGAQGYYNNTLWVDPFDPSRMLLGRQYLLRSTNGGLDWTLAGTGCFDVEFSYHADQHIIVHPPNYSASNKVVYVGTDGGLYRTNNIDALTGTCGASNGWLNLNNGLAITQFTGGAGTGNLVGSRGNANVVFGGTQDNGSLIWETGTTWRQYVGGDGGPTAYNPAAVGWLHGSYQREGTVGPPTFASPGPHTFANFAIDFSSQASPDSYRTNCAQGGFFYRPLVMHAPSNTLALGTSSGVCISTNPNNFNQTWRQLDAPASAGVSDTTAIDFATTFSQVMWFATYSPNQDANGLQPTIGLFKTSNALVAPPQTPTWTALWPNASFPRRVITRIYIEPADTTHQTVYITFGGFGSNNIWKTTNGGASWQNIHGTLPHVPIRAITSHPSNRNWLYVGTEVGVFTSENGGATWNGGAQATNDGPGNASVEHLFWTDSNTLVAATYGRGMFKATPTAQVCNLDVDGSGTRQALIDGVLVVRNMLNVSGSSFTSGISFAPSASRTTEGAIKSFIQANNYDVDGSGTQQALVDGVILVRLMLGVPNSTLLNGVAFPGSATITSASSIRANVNARCGTSF